MRYNHSDMFQNLIGMLGSKFGSAYIEFPAQFQNLIGMLGSGM